MALGLGASHNQTFKKVIGKRAWHKSSLHCYWRDSLNSSLWVPGTLSLRTTGEHHRTPVCPWHHCTQVPSTMWMGTTAHQEVEGTAAHWYVQGTTVHWFVEGTTAHRYTEGTTASRSVEGAWGTPYAILDSNNRC